jgi:uncharacterized protein (DUF433 family)
MKNGRRTKSRKPKLLGRYIVANPKICHGKPTFRGTRIMVWQVLEQIASGMAWESIIEEWEGSLTTAAIAEAVKLYRDLDFLLESRCQRMGHRING